LALKAKQEVLAKQEAQALLAMAGVPEQPEQPEQQVLLVQPEQPERQVHANHL